MAILAYIVGDHPLRPLRPRSRARRRDGPRISRLTLPAAAERHPHAYRILVGTRGAYA